MASPLRQIAQDGSLAYYYAQKAVRNVPMRQALGATVAAFAQLRAGVPRWPQTPVSERIARHLDTSGFAALPEKALNADTLQAVRQQLEACPLIDYYDPTRQYRLDHVPRDALKLRYRTEDVALCRPLTDLANDPEILAAVAARLGAKPTLATVESWWTFGEHNSAGNKAFDDIYHRDVDDLRFVKLFLYLTDTDITSGAHRFVLGSHADRNFTRRGAIGDGDVERAYPDECIQTVTGRAGTAFLEDTWGIHRALLATTGRRLIFSAIYVLAAHMPGGPRKPMLQLPPGYDRYVNRLLFT